MPRKSAGDKFDKMVERIEARLPYIAWDARKTRLIAAALRRVDRTAESRGMLEGIRVGGAPAASSAGRKTK